MTDSSPFLRRIGIQKRMHCGPATATRISNAFTSVRSLVEAVESDDPITDVDGIGPKTAEVIEDWWGVRERREKAMSSSTTTKKSMNSMTIHLHTSWADELGIDIEDDDDG